MPTKTLTGAYHYGVGTTSITFDNIKNNEGPKTATTRNPSSAATLELQTKYISGGSGAGTAASYSTHKNYMAFDCTDITEAPASAVLHLSDAGSTTTNLASDHKVILLAPDTATDKMGDPGAYFNSSGLAALAGGNTYSIAQGMNDIAGWGAGNRDSNVTKYSDPVNASLFVGDDGHDISITLNAAARAAMASSDIFILSLVDYTYETLGNDPQSESPSPGLASENYIKFSNAAGVVTGDFAPFIEYSTSAFTNLENESGALVGGDFTINTFSSAVLGAQFAQTGEQVPFSLGTPGVRHLRGRTTAYAMEKGETSTGSKEDKRERDKKKKEAKE